jgi:hypothetical protein
MPSNLTTECRRRRRPGGHPGGTTGDDYQDTIERLGAGETARVKETR